MADRLKEFARRARKEMCEDPEERKEILALIPIEERLKSVPLEQRLQGLSPEQRLQGLSPEQRLQGLSLEQLLQGVPLEELRALLAKLQREQEES